MNIAEGELTLEGFAHGALRERFADELQRVVDNIDDPNTEPEKVRSITIKVAFRPDGDRSSAKVETTVSTKLAGPVASTSRVFLSRMGTGRRLVAYEHDPRQVDLFAAATPNGGAS